MHVVETLLVAIAAAAFILALDYLKDRGLLAWRRHSLVGQREETCPSH